VFLAVSASVCGDEGLVVGVSGTYGDVVMCMGSYREREAVTLSHVSILRLCVQCPNDLDTSSSRPSTTFRVMDNLPVVGSSGCMKTYCPSLE
jgi:hypothetical protein